MFLAAVINVYLYVARWYDIWTGRPSGRVKDLPFGLVLKITNDPSTAHEGHIINFIREHTSIPVPHVVAAIAWYDRRFVLMKRVHGDNLQAVWRHLDTEQRANIVEQLRSFVLQLRALKSSHGPAVCGLNGAATIDSRVSSYPIGPFADESAFNDGLIDAAEPYLCEEILADVRSRMRDDHQIMFTHADLAPRNILVRGGTIVAVVDWEEAGWYPEHWEFVRAMYFPMARPRDEAWMRAIRDFIPEDYEKDWLVDCELSSRMVGAF
ncbi:hypothetical protein POSPLADRAFT_1142796 [Postia placenta MAD-698-R-SB12]|uniref:Aminoglycoside phosphotransferase domain-containing protein n=1 Tax=Postia placenta MAD-698-R-SB12 TaxID=670580 RepID=A0A1X6N1X5_9APHY|nr:hypothetical protein POSPLADRAFT_1142796 [Postia placenta MAD-698-R-SB12]OSX62482.1 hypothetical protein POSPLADRAFT_1142796 [Postia placenta MAD-698-R-SB12]